MGLTFSHVVIVSQFATMLGFVRAGIGLAIAPKSGSLNSAHIHGTLVPVEEPSTAS